MTHEETTLGLETEDLATESGNRLHLRVIGAMSPACNCDLAVLMNGLLCRVEVKTGYITKSGQLTCPHYDENKFDVLAIVRDLAITYRPNIEEWFNERKS